MTVECATCRIATRIPDLYVEQRRLLSRRRHLCPPCFKLRRLAVLRRARWASLAVLLAVGCGTVLEIAGFQPGPRLARVWHSGLNGTLVLVLLQLLMPLHELRHAVAGRLVGLRVFGVVIGSADPRRV